ncbi:hypothetical protein L209DRAFT_773255 [Thermothelomyces heterothallicus CBS 203.75]
MAGARSDIGSPSSSDDESVAGSGGGAPLYAWSPERCSLLSQKNAALGFHVNSAGTRSEEATDESLSAGAGSAFGSEKEEPETPSDHAVQISEPVKPRRSFSRSALRPTTDNLAGSSATSAAAIPPSLSLSAYPGPGDASAQCLPTLSLYAPASSSASGTLDRSSIPGSTTHSFISAMQAMTLHAAEDNLHPSQKAHREQTCKLQARVWGLRQGMYRQNSIPHDFLLSFDYDVQELMNNTVKMNQAVDQLAAELKKDPDECERIPSLEATIRGLESDLKDWKERALNAEKTLAGIAGRADEDMKTIQFLKEQLRQNEMARTILQEQVNGKRNLWLNVHSNPEERAAVLDTLARSSTPLSGQTFAMTTDHPYAPSLRGPASFRSSSTHVTHVTHSGSIDRSGAASPGTANPAAFHHGATGQLAGPLVRGRPPFHQALPHSHSVPAVYQAQPNQNHQRCLSNTTAASGRSAAGYALRPPSGPRRNTRAGPVVTETGSPKERKRSTPHSLVRAVGLEDSDCLEWADEFQSLFALVYGFCASYFHELPTLDDDWKGQLQSEANGQLWDYICKICRTHQEQEPGDHAMRLLKDRDSRPYLMQRLILQHILIFICSYEGWKDYSEDADDEMEKLEEELKKMDSSKTYDRQVIIDRRAQLVTDMAEGPNAAAFKNYKLTQHHQYLKTMVAPFLARRKVPNVTNEAFYDLFTITTAAWDLSAKLLRSRLTFQYAWGDAGARFSAETHEPLDCTVDRLTLQHEHCRLRFCATPAVTMRNDQGMTIDTKNILKAGVLVVMGY